MGASVIVKDLHITAGDQTLVDHLSFVIEPGEVLALIGESGSGKTTTALALMGYARHGCAITGGSVRIGDTDVLGLSPAGQRALRGRTVSYIAQSAAASFNPSRTIMDQVVEPARIHGTMPRAEAEAKAVQLFSELALPNPETIGQRYPHQVSGGQLQRLMAAMALITDPDLVILDEPTTALDVTTQIEVLRAFRRVVRERRATAVYVSHDLAVVAQMADTALNPSQTIERILARPLQFYKGMQGPALQRRIHELLDLVRLPHSVAQRLPGGLSGGQKQRVNLARALAAEPDLILCDEVTSALDTVVGAAVLDLMADLRRELGVSYLFISHDLHTVRAVCDEIIVMQHGRKLDHVARADFDRGPHHPYYELLAASVPELRQGWLEERDLQVTRAVAPVALAA